MTLIKNFGYEQGSSFIACDLFIRVIRVIRGLEVVFRKASTTKYTNYTKFNKLFYNTLILQLGIMPEVYQ
jgi:hypothetical protein